VLVAEVETDVDADVEADVVAVLVIVVDAEVTSQSKFPRAVSFTASFSISAVDAPLTRHVFEIK